MLRVKQVDRWWMSALAGAITCRLFLTRIKVLLKIFPSSFDRFLDLNDLNMVGLVTFFVVPIIMGK